MKKLFLPKKRVVAPAVVAAPIADVTYWTASFQGHRTWLVLEGPVLNALQKAYPAAREIRQSGEIYFIVDASHAQHITRIEPSTSEGWKYCS